MDDDSVGGSSLDDTTFLDESVFYASMLYLKKLKVGLVLPSSKFTEEQNMSTQFNS